MPPLYSCRAQSLAPGPRFNTAVGDPSQVLIPEKY